jgi:hypothetical protein
MEFRVLTWCICGKPSVDIMISPKRMDELFWGKGMEDIFDWTKRLQTIVEVKELDGNKLFKIAKFDLKGKAWVWYC